MTTVAANAIQHYQTQYSDLVSQLPGANNLKIAALRSNAIKQVEQLGFPTRKHEDWKYTAVDALLSQRFYPTQQLRSINQVQILPYLLPEHSALLVFYNGVLQATLTSIDPKETGLKLLNLRTALEDPQSDITDQLSAQNAAHGFTALNTALMNDGYVLQLAAHTQIKAPIQIIYLTDQADLHMQYRNLIKLENSAEAMVVETFIGSQNRPYFTNVITQVDLADNARLSHTKIQCENLSGYHVGTVFCKQQGNSEFNSFSLAVGGALVRSDIETDLLGEGAHSDLHGLYIAESKQHIDHHTRIHHAVAHGSSREHYKGIITGQAHAVFNGKVIVAKDAQNTSAVQFNKNLLLSPHAKIDTKPQLEIFADDVRCAHGATVGQLDPQAIFYLQSRGLTEATTARQLLIQAFTDDIIEAIKHDPIRQQIRSFVNAKLTSFMETE